MKTIGRLVLLAVANAVAFLAANQFIAGFSFSGDFVALVTAAGLLAIVQVFVRPILSLFFGPLILLSLGLFSIILNAGLLLVLDKANSALTIGGYIPLLLATLVVSAAHFVIETVGRWGYKD